MEFLLNGGGQQTTDLNDHFGALTPAFKPVFTKVFGDTTRWKTPVGTITFSFVFDPKASYSKDDIVASAWSDPLESFRTELQRHLLSPEERAPMASEDEVVWQYLRNNVPAELLTKHLASIDGYVDILETRAKKEYAELTQFTAAMNSTAWDFAVRIAIDAYPVPKAKRASRSRSSPSDEDGEEGGPHGVCVMHIMHELAGSETESAGAGSAAAVGSPALLARARASSVTSEDSVDFATTNLPGGLELGPSCTLLDAKRFPRDAGDFFMEASSWFEATIKKRTQELVEAQSQGASLYN